MKRAAILGCQLLVSGVLMAACGSDAARPPASTSTEPLDGRRAQLIPIASVDLPVDLAWRTSDPTLYVVGQDGLVVPVRDGQAGTAVLDMTDITSAEGERGLLGLAFHPTEPLAYVNHTDNSGDTVIAEYAVGADGVFDPASRREVLTIDQPYANHNGGSVVFGPDGLLYIGMGDGGSTGDPGRQALDVSTLLGKILRIDPRATSADSYAVPLDNPFVGVAGARPEIWAVGVRNPWRMSFDRLTGDLWFGDVGQADWEEIDVAWAADGGGRGLNFGWSAFEGTHRYNEDQSPEGVTMPIYEYPHGDAGCSVTGGVVYRGGGIPSLAGWYIYADYCSGQVRALRIADRAIAAQVTLATTETVSAVTEGPDGEVYVLSRTGTVYRLSPAE